MAAVFDPNQFFQGVQNVALHVPARELFGLLKRSFDLPVQWAALITKPDGDQSVIPAGGVMQGDDVENVLFARVTPFEVELEEEEIVTQDRFGCRARVRLMMSLIPERSELVSFLKSVIGSHRVAQARTLVQYLKPTVRSTLAKLASERDAASLVDGASMQDIGDTLADALQEALFTAGIMLEGRPVVEFDSKTLQQVQESRRDAAKHRAEHEAAAQVQQAWHRAQSDHLDHLAALLNKLGEMAEASPDVELPDLVRTFSERERGEIYEALFASEHATVKTKWIVVAAGDELLFFDPLHTESPARRLTISGAAGPVRSIHARFDGGGAVLLLGAATGVYRLPIERAEPDLTLIDTNATDVRGGFNSAVLVGDRVLASHSELGLCEWDTTDPEQVRKRFASMTQQAQAVRGVQFFEGDLYCAIDDRVIRFAADEIGDRPSEVFAGSSSTITALCPAPDGLFAGNSDGDVLHWPAGRPAEPKRLHTGAHRAAESLWVLDTGGVKRIVYSNTSIHICARVLRDSFLCNYEAGGQTLRRVEVAPDLMVATNDLRDRLICWTPGEPATPKATIAVSRLCGRSVQDVCLVS